MRSCTLLMLVSLLAAPLAAQAGGSAPGADLGVLRSMQGEWEGDAWMIIGPGPDGRRNLRQQEWVSTGAGGTVLVIKGLGREQTPDGAWVTRHDAFGIIFTGQDGKPAMRAFVANGTWMDMAFTVNPNGYTWQMQHPQAGLVRYEMTHEGGRWVEKGFASRDSGASWNQFMEMNLARKP